ncbi:S8 family serine peptidase [Draconibacterium sp. IB214405]|uniref:S8 family serine peptidase n=1 Tax=Draconibacterium sp. IB214405 TaxID=3097352 RepID=UPI002A154ACE|nr:S8 family serine peptidase [Draconibacterium sp. IB214405]MDX8339076.1 S8 family serine peptidase [Draconibacterium sp. IB214405]
MKKLQLKILALFCAGALIYSCSDSLITVDAGEDSIELKSATSAKNSYIVVLNDADLTAELAQLKGYEKKQNAVKAKSAKILERAGITDGEIGHVYGTALKGFSVKIAPGQLKKLENDVSVAYIEADKVIALAPPPGKGPNKGDGGDTGGGTSTQETPWGITRVGGAGNGVGKVAWIIDSGIDLDHPDLNVDPDLSTDFTNSRKGAEDENGHGTHVAGTIAAVDNSEGVVGVAAGATVVAVRVLDRRGSGSYSGVIAGVNYVAEKGALGDVANMSLGGGFSQSLNDAVVAASSKVKFVLAAGNESTWASSKSPASANGTNIFTISAMSQGDNWASFSNFGNPPVDYCAPGVSIKSTWKDGGYNTISGTSMAAPHAAGVLLMGSTNTDGTVNGDPDGNADPIIHR